MEKQQDLLFPQSLWMWGAGVQGTGLVSSSLLANCCRLGKAAASSAALPSSSSTDLISVWCRTGARRAGEALSGFNKYPLAEPQKPAHARDSPAETTCWSEWLGCEVPQ